VASSNTVAIARPLSVVFDLICDPTTYPEWLVGAQEIRHIDDEWPMVGSTFEHRIGVGPIRIPGSTTVELLDSPNHFALAAGMGPLGEARVDFRLRGIDGTSTEVTIEETPSAGLARIGWFIYRPVIFGLLWGRNAVSLHALATLAEATPVAGAVVDSPGPSDSWAAE
jgi:carbon monoxide dehydrogenase subunit G